MTTRRDMLILGAGMACLPACGGGKHPPADPNAKYGVQIADWSDAQTLAANAALIPGPPPGASAGTVLRLQQSASISFGQQLAIPAAHGYVPPGPPPGFSAGVWARNPCTRTLNFRLSIFDQSNRHQVEWNCAIDPADHWVFLTMSPSQQAFSDWVPGTDIVGSARISQLDVQADGPWLPGDTADFAGVYLDVRSRPLFLITFDDGNDTQRNAREDVPGSPALTVTRSDLNVFVTAARHELVPGDAILFPGTVPAGLASGVVYWVCSVPTTETFTLATDSTLGNPVSSPGFSGAAPFEYRGLSLQSGQQIVERYGFKGSLFLVPDWLGTDGRYGYSQRPNKFMSAAEALALRDAGWSIGSHSATHPSSRENAGLRLLGPYGYFLSNTVDMLPAQYVRDWQLDSTFRRRLIRAQAGSNLLTFENPHRFLANMPIQFVDTVPPGIATGVTYFCQSTPTPTTATLAHDQGSLAPTVAITSDWTGLGNYRYAGSAPDDSAIFNDIMAGIEGLAALGFATAAKFFALPQGAADTYVRSACRRTGLKWIRGASLGAHTINVGAPTGGGLSAMVNIPGGWLGQLDSVVTDSVTSPTLDQIAAYIDQTITQGACGCNYHHAVAGANAARLDSVCAFLRDRASRNLLDVVTLDRLADILGL
ncbi:hypothetical protein [Massilia horti]|uniref:Uncharacterized protein n=1 Tax=Massilia horti TaxID=2562153 RepID=A0A4Y9T0Z1_9BURK|nr:hypothetical protein [Massilia horti]TFW32873.1 hypothetical protein E4O92_08070 [Massilia horti]